MDTSFITKPAAKCIKMVNKPKMHNGLVATYRGLSVGAIVWLYATFPSKEWVKSQAQAIARNRDEIHAIDKRLAIEEATSVHIRPSIYTNKP